MTDPTHTTNEEIALELGWGRATKQDQGDMWFINPLGQWHKHVPDYEHDWAHAGPLLEEFLRIPGAAILPLDDNRWRAIWPGDPMQFRLPRQPRRAEGDTLTEAISRAWLAWKKEEK